MFCEIKSIVFKIKKYMAFTINQHLVFINSKQFMNSSWEVLIKNLSYNDFEYLSQEFNPEQLKLVKQKGDGEFKKIFWR